MVCTEAMLRGANVYKNCSKVGKTDLIIEYKGKCLNVDVKASSCHKSSAPGVALVHVDVESLKVRWARPQRHPWAGSRSGMTKAYLDFDFNVHKCAARNEIGTDFGTTSSSCSPTSES